MTEITMLGKRCSLSPTYFFSSLYTNNDSDFVKLIFAFKIHYHYCLFSNETIVIIYFVLRIPCRSIVALLSNTQILKYVFECYHFQVLSRSDDNLYLLFCVSRML